MTKAEIITSIRNLINEQSADAGAKLVDAGNVLEFINDAAEQVVLDLLEFMPGYFTAVENVSLVSGTASYTLTAEFWQIYKVQKNVTDENPVPIDIIDVMDKEKYMYVGETAEDPKAVYFLGNTMYPVPPPSVSKATYLAVHYVRPEAASMATGGPAYIPRPAHRLIVYKACVLIATAFESSPTQYEFLYQQRLEKIRSVWATFQQQAPRFLRGSYMDQIGRDSRDPVYYDYGWD
jgi:hypothetical protein